MGPDIVAAWVGAAVAGVIGVVGWVFAGLANRKAKLANKLAESANSIAERAAVEAARANKLAEDANRLSRKANTLSERTFLNSSEGSFVQWIPEWVPDRFEIAVTNAGRDTAFGPSIVVTGDELHQVGVGADTRPREKLTIPLPQIAQRKLTAPRARAAFIEGTTVSLGRLFLFPVSIVVLWKTEHGFERHERIEFEVCEGENPRAKLL